MFIGYDCDIRIERLLNKIKELQKNIHQTTIEITTLQTSLLKAEQKAQQMDSQSKILVDAKIELEKMKNLLKEKSIELATAKTEVKTLKSSLKIEEEMRLKNEKKITETLAATFKKWEKTKSASDQDYENKLTQKKNEISSINQKLEARENELATRVDECQHLQNKIESYKEMLKQIKDKAMTDKEQFEKNKNELIDSYEKKMIEIRQKLRLEKDSKCRLTMELTSVQSELRDSISSTTSDKEVNDRNVRELRARLNKEIERNNILRNENTSIENKCESLNEENEKLRQELHALSSPYITAHGSLSDLQVIEEQLRSDLAIAKENEDEQRKRASELEKLVGKLEGMLSKFSEQPKSVGDMLEKQNEKLEDKLAAAREQIIVEKQSARTAYMTSYKTEKELEKIKKELEESQQDHNRTKRRMELTEEKIKKVQNEKEQVERNLLDAKKVVLQKEQQIEELKSEINSLKRDVIDKMSTVHKLEENIADLSQKLLQAQRKTETVNMENKRLQKQIKDELSKASFSSDKAEELQTQLKSLSINYDRLKYACEITDSQLTEIEEMLENEQKQHKEKSDKLNKIYKILREKDDIILNLKNESMKLAEEKNVAEMKANNVQLEVDDVRQALEETQKKIINQQQQLIEQSNSLYEVQEKLELFANDSNSMQIMNENLFKEINILKEENTRILTDLYLSKEECLKTSTELKDAIQRINVNPSSILYRTLEEELKREQKKNKVLQDKLDKFERLQYIEKLPIKRIPSKNSVSSAEEAKSPERETQSHRFELTLDAIQGTDLCVVCDKPITSGLAHWKCKECFSKVHRLCRSNLKDNKCIVEPIQELFTPLDDLDFEIAQEPSSDKEYKGDLVLKLEESFGINCVYEVNSKIILLGGSAGLTAFHMDTRNFVTIGGLENVSRICTHHEFSNSIIIANGGERLFQCDLRHLNSRSQSNACTKPKLDTNPLSAKTGACHAIAATTARVVILKFDWEKEYKFRLVKALNLRISSILCTELTAIVSGDKFYEIDLDGDRDSCRDNFTDSYRYEELTDTLTHIRNYEPMAAFKISEEELLLCFMEGGIFLDRYGSKSRPYEVNWQFTPTGFMFQAPLLYVSHYNHVQIIRIHRSYSNDLNTQSYLKEFEGGAAGDGEDVDEHRMKRVLLDFERPKLLASREKLNVYLTSTNKQTDGQELYVLDGLTAFKQNTDYLSMETLSSEATCLTGSIDNFEN
uniref:Phorbol-ester/DAG-type domain-containing protein n=1 Tax=Megaselia scalaris TaxID=36166 RepID=T1GHN6_MEGSC